jgi:hypothetical protein
VPGAGSKYVISCKGAWAKDKVGKTDSKAEDSKLKHALRLFIKVVVCFTVISSF